MYEYDDPPPRVYHGGANGVTLANLLFAALMALFMWRTTDTPPVAVAVIILIYFLITTPLLLLIANGSAVAIANVWAVERTRRELYRLQYTPRDLHGGALLANPADVTSIGAAPQLPADIERTPTFVSPAPGDVSVYREAVAWLAQLYTPDGEFDGDKILMTSSKEAPGRVRGSAPSKPARELLINKRIMRMHPDGNGYFINMAYAADPAAAKRALAG